ncbi:MAG: DNA mismatch repair protein, partial [Paramarteilia canceri]
SIQRLDDEVINRIAAGEILQRPVNAIKELIENSIDANASIISIILKEGGLKMLQITDDGHGIPESDLPFACQRFCTSKLTNVSELENIDSFGFRGEALASLSHSSYVSIVSKTKESEFGYKALYIDGQVE